MFERLRGKKTYLMAALGALVVVLHYFGVFDDGARDLLLGLVGAGGAAALRAGIK